MAFQNQPVSVAPPYQHDLTSIEDPNGNTKSIQYLSGMVADESDYSGHNWTYYTYSNQGCATSGGCFGSQDAPVTQKTEVQYSDGEYDNDEYIGGRLNLASFGSTNDPSFGFTSGDALWQYAYDDPSSTNQDGPTTEIITNPTDQDAAITTDSVGNILSYSDFSTGGVTYQMYNDNESNDLDELC